MCKKAMTNTVVASVNVTVHVAKGDVQPCKPNIGWIGGVQNKNQPDHHVKQYRQLKKVAQVVARYDENLRKIPIGRSGILDEDLVPSKFGEPHVVHADPDNDGQ